MPDQAPGEEAREFAGAFRAFLEWIHIPATAEGNEVSALVRGFLGPGGARHSVVTRELPPFEHVNLQTAIDAWSAQAGRTVEVRGIALPPHYGGLSLQQLVAGEALPPLRLTAPALADLPNGPGSSLGCLRLALLLVTDASGRYIVMIQAPNDHQPALLIEVAGLPLGQAQRVLAALDQLRTDLNVLDAMDGAAADADLLFLLTTNRADLLEPALAARPGRVDVAVEIALPDAPARERLLTLYGRNVPLALTGEDVDLAVERTDGTTASFLKELIRRSVLESLHDDAALTTVTGAHLAHALDDLLDAAQAVTRTLLGVGVDPAELPAGGALTPGPGRAGPMMYAGE